MLGNNGIAFQSTRGSTTGSSDLSSFEDHLAVESSRSWKEANEQKDDSHSKANAGAQLVQSRFLIKSLSALESVPDR